MRLYRAIAAAVLASAFALSASAAFTPSIEYKEAPQVVEKTDEEGNVTVGEIISAEGEVIGTIPVSSLTVTAIASVKTTAATEAASEAAESLTAVEQELITEFENAAESAIIQAVAQDLNDAPVENIVVSDVLAVTATSDIVDAMASGAAISVSVTSQNITKDDETKITIYQKDPVTGAWSKVPFTIDENDIITLELSSVGEIVIFRDNEAAPVTAEAEEEAPTSPATSGDLKLQAKKAFIKGN